MRGTRGGAWEPPPRPRRIGTRPLRISSAVATWAAAARLSARRRGRRSLRKKRLEAGMKVVEMEMEQKVPLPTPPGGLEVKEVEKAEEAARVGLVMMTEEEAWVEDWVKEEVAMKEEEEAMGEEKEARASGCRSYSRGLSRGRRGGRWGGARRWRRAWPPRASTQRCGSKPSVAPGAAQGRSRGARRWCGRD